MDLYSWLTGESDKTASGDLPSPSYTHKPPGFLKIQSSKGGPGKTSLTPLEARLKDIIVSVYSDKKTELTEKASKTASTASSGKSSRVEKPYPPESELSPFPLKPAKQRLRDVVTSPVPPLNDTGIDSFLHRVKELSATAIAEDTSKSSQVHSRSPDNSLSGRSGVSRIMSDTHSIASTAELSTAPIFSADDRNVDLMDPDFDSLPPSDKLGTLPYSNESHSYLSDNQINTAPIIPGDRSNPVTMDFLNSSPSLLYSFTDPTTTPAGKGSKSKESRAGIVDSFGVPPDLFQSRVARPRQIHSVSSLPPSSPAHTSREETNSLLGKEPEGTDGGDTGTVDVPDLAAPAVLDVDGQSRDVTPIPESTSQDVGPAPIPTPESTSQGVGTAPIVLPNGGAPIIGQEDQAGVPSMESPHTTYVMLPVESGSTGTFSEDEEVPGMASLDSDMETASVVSVQQLTETYLNDPPDSLTDKITPASEGGKIPFSLPAVTSPNTPPPLSRQSSDRPSVQLRSPQPATMEIPRMSQHQPIQQRISELPSPSKLPAHISRSVSRNSSQPFSSPQPDSTNSIGKEPISIAPVTNSTGDDASLKELEEKLAEEQRARTYLEGQLEAVKEECEVALSERPKLLSKLSRAEAQLEEMASALEKERSKPKAGPEPPTNATSTNQVVSGLKEALEEEKRNNAIIKSRLVDEEKKSRQLETDLEDTNRSLADQESSLTEPRDKLRKTQAELARKTEEAEEAGCKLSSLEAGYNALEKNKSWLHDQLQEAQKAKLAFQEELRDSKATGITYSIKCDQLQKENSSLQEQITDMLRGVLQDKEKMVNELETIQVDVLSHEDLYVKLIAENTQLEGVAKRKEEAISQLSSNIARMQVEREELKKRATGNDKLSEDLQKENKALSSKLGASVRDLEDRESDLKEMERLKSTLQEKLRQMDAELAGKDGTIQSYKDANELLQQELALVNEAKEAIEKESAEVKRELAMLEAELRSSRGKYQERELQVQGALESQHSTSTDGQTQALRALLKEKEEEIKQREEAFQTLEAQTNELLREFNTLRDNFNSIASESGSVTDSIAEKDRVISHLASEKDKREEEIGLLERENQDLRGKLGQLQHENAHLLGQVEGAVDQDEYKKLLQDKTQLQDELNVLRVEQKREEIKAQSKINQLESGIRESQKTLSKANKELEALQDRTEEELSKAKLEKNKAEVYLKSVEEKLQRVLKEKKKVEEDLQQSVKPSEQHMYEMLKSKCEQLRKQNEELAEQVQQAAQQKAEVERASGLVASKLKQNAERERKELLKKNREISLELERLRGRLAGMNATQATMRDHATSLEIALAKKESPIVKLSAEVQKVLEEKQTGDKAFQAQIATLEGKVEELNTSIARQRERFENERQKVEDLEKELRSRNEADSANKSKKNSDVLSTTEQLAAISLQKEALQSDISYLKSQLLIAKTSAESAKRQIADKNSQVEILDRELKIANSRCQQAEEEVKQLKEHLRTGDVYRDRGNLENSLLGRTTGSFDGSPSRFSSSTDEVDRPGNIPREFVQQN